ncbi:pyridoxal phosphate-dependent transferase [Chaetomium fimeti]|uniref:Pyridoxal phosphate-dependent transferase n=1 Tax=Chaetomium fimeti TaxID=1854472 RepID=A0AAE0LWS8_9PEZI|nr:pyridoxal phosphate-dependent transferase [Chaetomium fimeti]
MTITTDPPNRAWGTKTTPGEAGQAALSETDEVSWGDPSRTGTAFDFRTDAITTPTLRQLAAIGRATLNDDVFGEDQTTTALERQMAATCGREAAAFAVSGTMANQLALGALCQQRPYGVLADASAHVVGFEAGGLASLSGATMQPVRPANGLHLTVGDLEVHARVDEEGGEGELGLPWTACPTRVVSLENTAHGNVIPLAELRAIREWTAQRGVLVHIDGARVWDAVASGRAGTLAEIAACADVLTLSFSKGIGAPIGAVVVGSGAVIRRIKRLRQSIGGGVRKTGLLAAAVREAVLENFGPGDVDVGGVFSVTHDMAAAVTRMWTDRGGKLLRPSETNMAWLDLASAGVTAETLNGMGMRNGILIAAPRIVLHHQICAKALVSLEQVFDDILVRRKVEGADGPGAFGLRSKGCVQNI